MSSITTTTTSTKNTKTTSKLPKTAIMSSAVKAPPPPPTTNRFSFKDDEKLTDAMAHLSSMGYVIIGDVISCDEIQTAMDMLWDWLEHLPGYEIDRNDVKTWAKWPGYPQSGVTPTFGVGQSPMMWYLRDRPKVKHVFETIWGTDRLLTSLDGCGTFRPWSYDESWKTNLSWEHVDQNPVTQKGRVCIQGVLSLTTADATTGSLMVYPRSHHHHTSLAPYAKNNKDFIMLPAPYIEQHRHAHGDPILVPCQAGDLILFDSRTIHCNTPATSIPPTPRDDEKWQLLRVVAYICMTPTYKASELKLLREDRYDAYRQCITTSHWPHFYYPSNKPHPPMENKLELNTTQKALLFGCTPEEVQTIEKQVLASIK